MALSFPAQTLCLLLAALPVAAQRAQPAPAPAQANLVPGNFVDIKTAATDTTRVAGALSSNGYAAWAWTDDDASFAGDVKAQNINFDGTLGVAAPDDVIFADGFDGAP